jgi:hypothetical protein
MKFEQLLRRLIAKTLTADAWRAAISIQKFYRGHIIRKNYYQIQELRNKVGFVYF